jgi:hypothetical protein
VTFRFLLRRSSIRPGRCFENSCPSRRSILATFLFVVVLPSQCDEPAIEIVPLPPLQVLGRPASAHTQGLELVDRTYLVTARQENVSPKRALLLRTSDGRSDWDCWDVTPTNRTGETAILDHPGGIQSDGERLWIPVAESRRNSRTRIRAYALDSLMAGRSLTPAFEFAVADHIGAVAVSRKDRLLLGASWDTEKVYVWDLRGQLKRILNNDELVARGLGVTANGQSKGGIAVQDWKLMGEDLFASGLFGVAGSAAVLPTSRFCRFEHFLDIDFQYQTATLPQYRYVELAREAMAVSDGTVYFLPEDLGTTNRLFRAPLASLMERNKIQ